MRTLLALILSVSSCFAQAGKAELFGMVTDPSSLAVSGARVSAEDPATGLRTEARTDDRGAYHLIGLKPGSYTVTVAAAGFRPIRQTGLTLRIEDRTRLNFGLEAGPAAQSVEVRSDASLLETVTGAVNYHVTDHEAVSFPLDGRNFIPLVALSPGVALPGGGSLLPRINGSRPRTNEYLYDGISVLQPEPGNVAFYPVIDSIEEFRLNINSYSPEYGRSNRGHGDGGGQIGRQSVPRHALRIYPQ